MASFVTLFFLLFYTGFSETDKLKLSILMFRHGDRSPISTIPNDIYSAVTDWPQGPGQLSEIGEENHIRNGKFFKARYTDPSTPTYLGINPNYKAVEVYVRSTDVDRTIMSAQSFLAGLFPPKESNLTSPLNVWQPIPVHNVPKKSETMLDGAPQNCKVYRDSFLKTVENSPEFQSFMENHTNITKEANAVCGWPEDSDVYNSFLKLSWTYDVLFCEKSHNYSFKQEFVDANLYNLVVPYGAMEWELFNVMTDKEKALSGGVLLRELKMRVKAAVEKQDAHKLIIFSGHDTTLASILTALGVYDGVQTPYATVLMLELWETEAGAHIVKFLRHHMDDDLLTYTLPGCDESGCTLDQFYSVRKHLELSEEELLKECAGEWPDFVPAFNKNVLFILLCITTLIALFSTLIFTLYVLRMSIKSSYSVPIDAEQKQVLLENEDNESM